METHPKRTPIAGLHEALGARMVGFGGWWMPVQYQGIIQEHQAVRKAAGLFDISHMGEVFVSGPDATAFLNRVLTNDVSRLGDGDGQYTLMLNEDGGVIDDLLCYRLAPNHYLLVVNASMIDEDVQWLKAHAMPDTLIDNQSDAWAGFALQGPRSAAIAAALLGNDLVLPARNTLASIKLPEGQVLLARTGYTGEDGFEWFCPAEQAAFWWGKILAVGASAGLVPCGLGCRDTLRLEVGYPLNGSDLSPTRTPLDAGLGFFVKLDKGPFLGSEKLTQQKAHGTEVRLMGLLMEGKTPPPRSHYPIVHDGVVVSETTSGSLSPTLGTGVAMAYLPIALAQPGTRVEIDIRGKHFPAIVSKRPMYRASTDLNS